MDVLYRQKQMSELRLLKAVTLIFIAMAGKWDHATSDQTAHIWNFVV